jgi:drug/metabolite transporter (DMT)-like permease
MSTLILIAVVTVNSVVAAFASYFLKKGSGFKGIRQMFRQKFLWLGGAMYVATVALGIVMLRYYDLTVMVPFGALTYVWSLLIGRFLLKERVTTRKAAGVALIIAGAVVMVI